MGPQPRKAARPTQHPINEKCHSPHRATFIQATSVDAAGSFQTPALRSSQTQSTAQNPVSVPARPARDHQTLLLRGPLNPKTRPEPNLSNRSSTFASTTPQCTNRAQGLHRSGVATAG